MGNRPTLSTSLNDNRRTVDQQDGLLFSPFLLQASRTPNQPAVISGAHIVTYGRLLQLSSGYGKRLLELGHQRGDLIGVMLGKGWEQVAAVLAIMMSGAAYVPIPPDCPSERLKSIIEKGDIRIVVTNSSIQSQYAWPDGIRTFCIDDDYDVLEEDDAILQVEQAPEDLAYVIFTSGSTGDPKGVMIQHHSALNTILDINDRFHVGTGDRVLALSPLNFDLSVYDIFGTLAAGGTIVMPMQGQEMEPAAWYELVRQEGVTIWNTVPALMNLFLEYIHKKEKTLPRSLRLALFSGDWIPIKMVKRMREMNPNIDMISLGGATEASIWSVFYKIDQIDPSWNSIPYGKALTNQSVYVLDDNLEPCSTWEIGKIYIGGRGLALGYLNDESKTAKQFIVHPKTGERLYDTGDLGRVMPDQNIEILGREDFQVKLQGHRVELGEIEAVLNKHPDVRMSIVVATKADENAKLTAFIEPENEHEKPDGGNLRFFMMSHLPSYMIPQKFVYVTEWPLTPNGKIDRKNLEAVAAQADPSSGQMTAPREISAAVLSIIQETLALSDEVKPDSNLLELGANSVDIIRIINEVDSIFHYRPNINEFYRNPTAAWLIQSIPENQCASSSPVEVDEADDLIRDPIERERFRKKKLGYRQDLATKRGLKLLISETDDAMQNLYQCVRSRREFTADAVSFSDFSGFLQYLRGNFSEGEPRHLYGSAGGTYAVQTYIYVKPGRIQNIEPGIYYYDPLNHELKEISVGYELPSDIYDPFINRPIFESCAFSIFFVMKRRAIAPLYGDKSLNFASIEAGLMSQLLIMNAAQYGLGICQIGDLDFTAVRGAFNLETSDVLVHSLVGGPLSENDRLEREVILI